MDWEFTRKRPVRVEIYRSYQNGSQVKERRLIYPPSIEIVFVARPEDRSPEVDRDTVRTMALTNNIGRTTTKLLVPSVSNRGGGCLGRLAENAVDGGKRVSSGCESRAAPCPQRHMPT